MILMNNELPSGVFWLPVTDKMERETHHLFLSRCEGDWSWEIWGGYLGEDGEWVVMPDHSRLENERLEPMFYARVDDLLRLPASLLPNSRITHTEK
jgi:hypothetical protein